MNQAAPVSLDQLLDCFDGVRKSGSGYEARCPCHEDEKASLSIGSGYKGPVLKCHAGCPTESILSAVGITWQQLFGVPGQASQRNGTPRKSATGKKPRTLARADVESWNAALKSDPETLRYATEVRRFSPAIIDQLLLGLVLVKGRRFLAYPYQRDGIFTYAKLRAIDGEKAFMRRPAGAPSHLWGLDALEEGGTAIVFEGEGDAVAALSVGLQGEVGGVGGAAVVSVPDGVDSATKAANVEPLQPQGRVYVAFDADEAGDKAALALAREVGADMCRRVRFGSYKDLGEALAALGPHATLDLALKAVREADAREPMEIPLTAADEKRESPSADGNDRPVVYVRPEAVEVVNEALAALSSVPGVYQRAGILVHVVRDPAKPKGIRRPAGAPRIAEVREPRMLELLSGAALWVGRTRQQSLPPSWAVKAALARGEWPGIPPLTGVVETPVLRADGSVVTLPGYDTATGLFYAPPAGLDLMLPENPTRQDAERAGRELLDVVADFPFAGNADRAAWLASTITPLCRFAIGGPVPLFLIDGNTRGCGKSLLADVTGLIAAGRDMTRMAPPEKDEEMRKRITALALAGDPMVLIDNVVSSFGWASLDAALTGQSWDDRILGQSKTTGRLDLASIWYATGNNIILAADVVRRVLHIRLETTDENPEERTGFRHPDLRAYVVAERPRLLGAVLTILRAYSIAGCPSQGLAAWGSFEAWSGLVRGALAWAGVGDPAASRREFMAQADRDKAVLHALLVGLHDLDPTDRGFTTADVLKALPQPPPPEEEEARRALRWAVTELAGDPPRARTLGKRFQHLQRRVIDGRCLDRAGDTSAGARWRVGASSGGEGSSGSDLSSLPRVSDPGIHLSSTTCPAGAQNTPTIPTTPTTQAGLL